MCYPVKCEKCGKTTWAGCGKHKDMVMAKVPENERCTCPREGEAEPVPDKPNTSSNGGDHGNVKDITSEKEFKDLMNRLKRIEGQVRGVEGMLENDAYCTDILMQVSAITCALNSFNKALLANHMKTCVVDNIREGNEEVIDELVATLQKLMK